ncbi:iron chelate uptake ABC transporter family permease subunit, partial [Klebsiella pneumoniae]|uniref:iron chelate uptake ABC transporter family permease subunit n=1 Tax=Klebsiella pneumoniae TaxID=573 RepID=UPI003D15FABC
MIAPSRRLIASCLLLMAASLLISLLGLAQGPVPLTIDQVFSVLFGDAPRNVAMVVNEWRLPRVLMALLIGADGQVLPHVRPLSDPAFHRPAERAVSS